MKVNFYIYIGNNLQSGRKSDLFSQSPVIDLKKGIFSFSNEKLTNESLNNQRKDSSGVRRELFSYEISETDSIAHFNETQAEGEAKNNKIEEGNDNTGIRAEHTTQSQTTPEFNKINK